MTKTPETTSTIIRGIPVDLWRKVKAKAALEGVSLRALMIRLLREYVR